MIDIFVKPLASIAYLLTKFKEKRLGYQIVFKNLSKNWLPAKVIYEMDNVWKREGLEAVGMNYFTIGAIENGLSSRFNPHSLYYQSWLGGYVVRFSEKRNWEINDHFRLGEADQKNWLRIYGNKNPIVDIDYKHAEKLGSIEISGFKGHLYKGNIYSDTDVGREKISLFNRLQISGLAVYFNKTNKNLYLASKNFIPNWTEENLLTSYQKVQLKGYIAILNISNSIKAVLYANAARYKDRKGKEYDNFAKLDEELIRLIKAVDIQKI